MSDGIIGSLVGELGEGQQGEIGLLSAETGAAEEKPPEVGLTLGLLERGDFHRDQSSPGQERWLPRDLAILAQRLLPPT